MSPLDRFYWTLGKGTAACIIVAVAIVVLAALGILPER